MVASTDPSNAVRHFMIAYFSESSLDWNSSAVILI